MPVVAIASLALASATLAEDVTLTPEMLVAGGNEMFDTKGFVLPNLSDRPLLLPSNTRPPARLLRHLAQRVDINGHRDVLYDNRDRGHSTLRDGAYPGLARLRYSPDLGTVDFGLATRFRYPAIVIGNSSTAITSGTQPRSLPRLAMTRRATPRQMFSLYVNNHLYTYPEHRDHDAVDLFPANWPLSVTSQGSSGSDQAFLNAFLMVLAAMPRETVEHIQAQGLVAPTLQMILRRNLRGVDDIEDYFSSAAHPTVFDAEALRIERMIGHAADLSPLDIAPMVRLSVTEESFQREAGLSARSELLFDTPVAIARIWRGFDGRSSMRVSASQTNDPMGREIAFRWVLLRGDPAKVRISPNSSTAEAEIEIDWHDAFQVPVPGGSIATSRVDIGVFADTGGQPSAPSIISIHFPTHQARVYSTEPGGIPVLKSIDYDARGRGKRFDPSLFWTADWVDAPRYGADGELVGWLRRENAVTRTVPVFDVATEYVVADQDSRTPELVEERR